jgi:hypothetical protein
MENNLEFEIEQNKQGCLLMLFFIAMGIIGTIGAIIIYFI